MKKTLKIIWILLACVVVLGLGLGVRALILQRDVRAEAAIEEQPVYAAENAFDLSTSTAAELAGGAAPQMPTATVEPIEPGLDLKRGSFLTDELLVQLDEIVAEEAIGGVWVGASNIVHGDTRAFVRVCMALEGSAERLMFSGPIWLDFPGGKSDAFFVHNDIPDEEGAACEVLEFVGVVPEMAQDGWRFTMENVMYTIPDEGTECGVYQKRAEADKRLQDAGIAVTCSHGEGMTTLEIASKPAGLSEAEAQKMIDDVVYGRYHGPWVYDLPMEPGRVQPSD